MTRPHQKEAERRTLDLILAALGVCPDREPEEGEAPDFTVRISGKMIGVEITMYRSGGTVEGGQSLRAVESEWDLLKQASDDFRRGCPKMRDISVGLMFKGPVPPRKQHQTFIEEITAFVDSHNTALTEESADYWPHVFTTPLMQNYLRTVYLRRDKYAEWYSDITAGYVARPDRSIAAIVAEKSQKMFRPADEIWLAIQCSSRISELVLEIEGVADFQSVPSLEPGAFARVFFLTFTGSFEWRRGKGWRQLTGASPDKQVMSFDELKGVLNDPKWLNDPGGKASEIARQCLQEIRNEKSET